MTNLNKNGVFKAFGKDMYPLLRDGDILNFTRIPFDKIRQDDIIIHSSANKFLAHRVLYTKSSYVITKGDNILHADPPVLPSQIIGKVTKVRRNGEMIYPELLYSVQSTRYLNEINILVKELKKQNIDFVILKGLPLHLYYEKRHPRRIYADCDILIDKTYLEKVISILEKEGYLLHSTNKSKHAEFSYYKIVNSVPVVFDIHLEPVFMMTRFDVTEQFYSRTLLEKFTKECLINRQIVQHDSFPYPILKQEYLVLYLALHFFHHNFKSPARLQILITIITSSQWRKESWATFLKIAQKYHLKNFIYPTLRILNKYYGIKPPDPIMKAFSPRTGFIHIIVHVIERQRMFDEESGLIAGAKRMLFTFLLSPAPLLQKLSIIRKKSLWMNIFRPALHIPSSK